MTRTYVSRRLQGPHGASQSVTSGGPLSTSQAEGRRFGATQSQAHGQLRWPAISTAPTLIKRFCRVLRSRTGAPEPALERRRGKRHVLSELRIAGEASGAACRVEGEALRIPYYDFSMPEIQETACLECDLMIELEALESGQRARCPRCGGFLTRNDSEAMNRGLAFALASAVLLVMANSFPFLELHASGLEKVMTIPQAGLQLYQEDRAVLAGMVLGPIAVVPAVMLTTMIALLVPLRRGARASWLVPTGKLLFALNPWSMVEVFIIGVLVSLVKIGAMATVVIGISFWAYIAFVLCFIVAVGSLDRFQIWREIEACQA